MVIVALGKMKSGKAAGPSGIIVEMLKAAGDTGITFLRELITCVVTHGKIPEDWEKSFILYSCNAIRSTRTRHQVFHNTRTRTRNQIFEDTRTRTHTRHQVSTRQSTRTRDRVLVPNLATWSISLRCSKI